MRKRGEVQLVGTWEAFEVMHYVDASGDVQWDPVTSLRLDGRLAQHLVDHFYGVIIAVPFSPCLHFGFCHFAEGALEWRWSASRGLSGLKERQYGISV